MSEGYNAVEDDTSLSRSDIPGKRMFGFEYSVGVWFDNLTPVIHFNTVGIIKLGFHTSLAPLLPMEPISASRTNNWNHCALFS